eukprot:Amastigsp_a178774_199.p2 type:complete len:135 gc:universal Amastigsp_a178774_199:434-30(-)
MEKRLGAQHRVLKGCVRCVDERREALCYVALILGALGKAIGMNPPLERLEPRVEDLEINMELRGDLEHRERGALVLSGELHNPTRVAHVVIHWPRRFACPARSSSSSSGRVTRCSTRPSKHKRPRGSCEHGLKV